MRPSYIKNIIKMSDPNGPAIMLLGPSGVGKSEVVFQAGEELGFIPYKEWATKRDSILANHGLDSKEYAEHRNVGTVYTFNMLLQDEVAMHGMPDLSDDKQFLQWKPSLEIPIEQNYMLPTKGIYFMDEYNTARRGVQTTGYSITLEKRIGNYFIMNDWYIVMAGNRQEDKGEIYDVPGPLKNRIVRIFFDIHFGDWLDWASRNNIDNRIIAYLLWKVDGNLEYCSDIDDNNPGNSVGMLWNYDHTRHVGWNWPTPRAWSKNIDYYLSNGILNYEPDIIQEVLGGCVGESAAVDFINYLSVYSRIPNPEDVLDKKVPFPSISQPELAYAVALSLIEHVKKFFDMKDKNATTKMEQLLELASDDTFPAEFGMLMFKSLDQKRLVLQATRTKSWPKMRQRYGDMF